MSQQPHSEFDDAYEDGKADAERGVRFRGEHYTGDDCTVAYARGYIDGNPTRDYDLACVMASPCEDD